MNGFKKKYRNIYLFHLFFLLKMKPNPMLDYDAKALETEEGKVFFSGYDELFDRKHLCP